MSGALKKKLGLEVTSEKVEALMRLARRVDRLRLCGNGVPLVAAHALRTLAVELSADG